MGYDKQSMLDWIYSLRQGDIRPGLENVGALLERLGNPHMSFRSMHVAGTDGKGSVSACLSSVLIESGLKVGLYTSPHILEFNERIRVNGESISDGDLEGLADMIVPIVKDMMAEGQSCTFFEITTAMAFQHFKDQGIDYAVVEVGMGGRLDATNLISPDVCVITNISMDHIEFLGDSLESIAMEKGGIIKAGVPCVTMNDDKIYGILKGISDGRGSRLSRVVSEDVGIVSRGRDGTIFNYNGNEFKVTLPGRFQARNAALAIEALRLLGMPYVNDSIQEGLKAVRWPCRLEYYVEYDMIVDVSHTVEGIKALVDEVIELYGNVQLVFGMMEDKDWREVLRMLSDCSKEITLVRPNLERAANLDEMEKVARECFDEVNRFDAFSDGMRHAFENGDGTILVTGSFHMAEEALRWLGTSARF